MYTLNADSFGWDGSYYYNIAQNIRDSLGFTTNISLYHQGMTYFPHPTPVYPVWPYVLGYLGRFVSMDLLAHFLPVLFYFLTWWVVYCLIQKVLPGEIVFKGKFVIKYAHVGVLIFFLHSKYFEATSKPYTEGIAYLLLLVCFWRLILIMPRCRFITGLEIGLWAAILFLTRSQFIVFLFSVCFFYLMVWVLARQIKYLAVTFTIIASFLLCSTPQLIFLFKSLGVTNPLAILFFDQYQASAWLSPLDVLVGYRDVFEFLYYKFTGVMVAFLPWGKYSYAQTFHLFQYSFVLLVFILLWVYRKRTIRKDLYQKIKAYILNEEKHFILFFIFFAAAAFASIHLLHKKMWAVWNFPTRHSLICSLIFFLSFIYLFKQNLYPWLKQAALYIFFLGVLVGVVNLSTQTVNQLYSETYSNKMSSLIHWLKNESAQKPSLRVAMWNPQKLSVYTDGVDFHWIYYNTSQKDLRNLFTKLGVNYLLLKESERRVFQKKIDLFEQLFSVKVDNLSGYTVLYLSKNLG